MTPLQVFMKILYSNSACQIHNTSYSTTNRLTHSASNACFVVMIIITIISYRIYWFLTGSGCCQNQGKERKGKQRKGTLINNCCATVGAVHALEGSERKAFDRCTDLILLLPVAMLGITTWSPKHFCLLGCQLELPYVRGYKMINRI